jgi:RNA polymerase sigma factor (TIGR02999 family)
MVAAQYPSAQLRYEWQDGNQPAQGELVEKLYPWLNQTAAKLLSKEYDVSLASGDLVHEATLKLLNSGYGEWKDRPHFLALASKIMRQVLIDHVRAKRTDKRDHHRVTLMTHLEKPPSADVQALHEALLRLAAIDATKSEIVEMRYFGGMSIADIAEVLDLSERTVKRRWASARAWLMDAIQNAL